MAQQQEDLKIYLILKKALKDEAGIAPLYARITPAGQKPFELNTNISLPVTYWDQDDQQIINKAKCPQQAKEIKTILEKIEETHQEFSSTGALYSPQQRNKHCKS